MKTSQGLDTKEQDILQTEHVSTDYSVAKVHLQEMGYDSNDRELVKDLDDLKACETIGSMSVFPAVIEFETQESDEKVVLVMRRAPITNLKWILTAFVMSLVPLMVGAMQILPEGIPERYLLMASMLWELVVIGFGFEEFLRWYFGIYIVTDRRVVDIDFPNILHREFNDADLIKVQDVTVRSQGLFAAFFNYGTIIIQTAGEQGLFEFAAVQRADKVASVIRLLALQREHYLSHDDKNRDGV